MFYVVPANKSWADELQYNQPEHSLDRALLIANHLAETDGFAYSIFELRHVGTTQTIEDMLKEKEINND